ILAMTFVWSFVSEAVRPAALAAVAGLAAPSQRRAAFALIRLAVNLGMSVGPAVGGFLAVVSFRALFWADSVTSLLAGAVLLLWPLHVARRAGSAAALLEEPVDVARDIEAESATPPTAAVPSDVLGVLRDPRLVYFLLALIPVFIVFFQLTSAMPLFLVQHLGLPKSLFGLIFTLNTLLIVAVEVPLNLAMAHWRHRHALALGAMLYAVGFGALALVTTQPAILATVVIWTFGEMILLPTSAAYIAEIAPPGKQGECMGVYSMTFSLAFAVGPWLGATVLQQFGPEVLWVAVFVSGCVSALLMSRVKDGSPAD
ncbi:MAG: MFS transporter, partial [Candidatus Acidiferrales bacterium]